MNTTTIPLADSYKQEHRLLFEKRVNLAVKLGAFFVLLFALLDYIAAPEQFQLFLQYRTLLTILLGVVIFLLSSPLASHFTALGIALGLVGGTVMVSVMTLQLGGFASEYYIGILIIIAGAFSVLPLTMTQAALTGIGLYLIYLLILSVLSAPDTAAVPLAINNSFFFLSLVIICSVQCFEEERGRRRMYDLRQRVNVMRRELGYYTHDLEKIVEQRVEKIAEARLRYSELYDSMADLAVLLNEQGQIVLLNEKVSLRYGLDPELCTKRQFLNFVTDQDRNRVERDLLDRLMQGDDVWGVRFGLSSGNKTLEVECNGKKVTSSGGPVEYQLVLRDISLRLRMEQKLKDSFTLQEASRSAAILGLARLAEHRDIGTGTHLRRIREYTKILANELAELPSFKESITPKFIEELYLSSVLHDIGKVGIPDDILLKTTTLSPMEFEIIKRHCEYGAEALREPEEKLAGKSFLTTGREIALYHHEKWDGSGYPKGLKGEEIPLSARIVALADVYDALTSKRSYRDPGSHDEAKNIIIQKSGSHFDPRVVNAFLSQESAFRKVRITFLMHGEEKQNNDY